MKKITTAFLLLFSIQFAYAQVQYGHLNYGTLLSVLPETQQADKTLEAYQKDLEAALKVKVEDYKKKYSEVAQKVQDGLLSPGEIAKYEEEFKQTEDQLKFQEIQISEKVAKKRKELLDPIIERANAAINAVAKERGLLMIFDTSIFNAILAATDEADMMPYVLAKLGIDYNK